MKRIVLTLIFGLLTAFGTWYGLNPWVSSKISSKPHQDTLALKTGTLITPPKPLIPFELKTTQGSLLSERTLIGKWSLLFFGYADCPYICPEALKKVKAIFEFRDIAPLLGEVQFVFISLNPEQDSVEKLQKFLGNFNKTFIGATGLNTEMQKLAESCRIYHWSEASKTNAKQKIIDHSATLILINPEGRLQALFSPPLEPKAIMLDLLRVFESRKI